MNELVYSEEIVQGWRGRGLAGVSEAGGGQARLGRPKAWLVSIGGERRREGQVGEGEGGR